MINFCLNCRQEKEIKARGYCIYCYHHCLNQGIIKKIEKKILPTTLTNLQNSLLTGGLLGDMSLRKRGNQNASLSVSRSYIDKKYLDWEFEVFKDFCSSAPKEGIVKRKCHKSNFDEWFSKLYYNDQSHIKVVDLGDGYFQKEFKQVSFYTRNVPMFNDIYYKWYPNGTKIVPNDLFLDTNSICIWFCDDGCIRTPEKNNRFVLQLSTNGFSKEENEFLVSLLKNRYNEYFYVSKDNNTFLIRGADAAARELLKDIDNVIPPGMERKANIWRKESANFYNNQPLKFESRIIVRNKNIENIILFINEKFNNKSLFTIKELSKSVNISFIPAQKYIKSLLNNNIIIKETHIGDEYYKGNSVYYKVINNDVSSTIFAK